MWGGRNLLFSICLDKCIGYDAEHVQELHILSETWWGEHHVLEFVPSNSVFIFFKFLLRWIQFWKRPNGSSVLNDNIQVFPGKPMIKQWVMGIYANQENDRKLCNALPELRTTEKESFEWQSGYILCLNLLVEQTAECCISRIQNVSKMLDFSLPGKNKIKFLIQFIQICMHLVVIRVFKTWWLQLIGLVVLYPN